MAIESNDLGELVLEKQSKEERYPKTRAQLLKRALPTIAEKMTTGSGFFRFEGKTLIMLSKRIPMMEQFFDEIKTPDGKTYHVYTNEWHHLERMRKLGYSFPKI